MKIIIAPSKTQDKQTMSQSLGCQVVDQKKSDDLYKIIKSMSKKTIGSLMKIKKKLLDETYNIYQSYEKDMPKKKAIQTYQGIVFSQVNMSKYTPSQIEYMNEHLVILSAMYGPLRPDSLISPYRLDLTMKPNKINLYQYWQDTIDHYFNEEVIINLASNEFSRMIKKQKKKMITISFKDGLDSGKLKVVSIYAKKARGKMLDMMIKERVIDPIRIQSFDIDGYHYAKDLSNENHYIFVRY